jgi:glycosyltransferase involved in cell wall biosynthesis
MAPYYRAMDVLVLPTWREGFPNVVLEAAASGIPVVTTFCTGARDSVVPSITGLLIPPGNSDAICEAVLQIVRNPQRSRIMGHAARDWVLQHYPEERVVNITADYYRSLLEMPPLPRLQRA